MDMKSAEITVPKGSWVIGNVDYMGFYRTNYDEEMWEKLTEQLQKDHKVRHGGLSFNLPGGHLRYIHVKYPIMPQALWNGLDP